jgi:tetratricopeptide (TPR) repeat protein
MVLANAAKEVGEKFENLPLIESELRSTIAKTYSAFELYKEAESHIFAAFSIGRRVLGDDHPQTIHSLIEMGDLFVIQGKYDKALPYYMEASATASRVLGEDHPDRLKVISSLGNLFVKQGNYKKAWSYHTEALERRRRVLGDDHLDTLNSGSNVGDLLAIGGRYDEAMIYHTVVLENARRTLGDDHPTTCQSLGKIGDTLLKQGKYDEVMPYYTEASETARSVFGDDHPETLRLVTKIGDLLLKQGNYSKALFHCVEALENAQRYFGQGHAYTLQSFRNIISIYEAWEDTEPGQGHKAKADEYRRNYHDVLATEHPRWIVEASSFTRLSSAQRCFEQWLRVLTRENSTRKIAGDMELLASMLPARMRRPLNVKRTLNRDELELFEKVIPYGLLAPAIFVEELTPSSNTLRVERSLSVLEKQLASARKTLGDEHIDTLVKLFNCGALCCTINNYDDALLIFKEVLETSRRVFGQDHPYTITSIANVGYVLNAQGQYDQATPYYVEALEESRRVLGDDHARTAEKMLGMGTLLSAQGKYDQARPYYTKAVEINRRALGNDHPKTLVAIELLCCLVTQQSDYEEAVEISRRFLGDDHPQTFDLMSNKIGRLLTYRGNYDQAHGFIKKALELSSVARGEYDQSTILARSDLMSLYSVWHRAEPGQGYGAKARELIDKNFEMMNASLDDLESKYRTVETSPDYPTE